MQGQVGPPRTKVLFVSHLSSLYGAERCLLRQATGLNRTRFEPVVVLPGPGPLQEHLRAQGVRAEIMEIVSWSGFTGEDPQQPLRFWQGLKGRVKALAEFIRQERCDLVVSNTSVIVDGALAARFAGLPHAWQIHELVGRDLDLFPFLTLPDFFTLIEFLSDKIITTSECSKLHLEQFIRPDKTELIYSGIELTAAARARPDKVGLFGLADSVPVVTFVGLLSRTKGVLQLPEAAPQVLETFPQTRFIVAGDDGGASAELQRAIEAQQLQHAFHLLGHHPDALSVMASSDLVVLPSLVDCFPTVVLEAMMLAKPVVATRSGGAAEMVVDEETGLLVPAADPGALAHAIVRLLQDRARMRDMGQRGRVRVEKVFGMKRAVARLEQLFNDLAVRQTHAHPLTAARLAALWNLFEGAYAGPGPLDGKRDTLGPPSTSLDEHKQQLGHLQARVGESARVLDRFRNHPLYRMYRRLKRWTFERGPP